MNKNLFNFINTGLNKWIVDFLKKKKLFFATPLQQACIPSVLGGKDLFLYSRTGTGKTMTYILPTSQLIYEKKKINQAIILIPTRELGLQIYDIISSLGKRKKLKIYFIGQKFEDIKSLKCGRGKDKNDCLISTPKNFSKYFFFEKKKKSLLILDEADYLIGKNFSLTIELIFSFNKPFQLILVMASFQKKIFLLKYPKYKKRIFFFHEKINKYPIVKQTRHEYVFCTSKLKPSFLEAIMRKKYKNYEIGGEKKGFSIIIFVKNSIISEFLKKKLEEKNLPCLTINKMMNDNSKLLTIQLLKTLKNKILISTDLGSRGLDLPMVDLVLNYNFPKKVNTYIHRVGRTSRFFKKGFCLNLISPGELEILHFFQEKTMINLSPSRFLAKNEILKVILEKNK